MAEAEKSDTGTPEEILKKTLTRRQAISTMGKAAIGVGAAVVIGGAAYATYVATKPGPSTSSSSSTSGLPSYFVSPPGKQIYYTWWSGDFAVWENNAIAEWNALPLATSYPLARVSVAGPGDILTALKAGVPIDSGQYYAGSELSDAVRQGFVETYDANKYPYDEVPGLAVQDPWLNNNGTPQGSGEPSSVVPPGTDFWSGGEALDVAKPTQPFFNFYGTEVAAIPFNVTPYPLYMNRNLFQKAGVDVPTLDQTKPYTWDELWPALQAITSKLAPATYGIGLGAGLGTPTATTSGSFVVYEFTQIMWGFGGDWAVEGKDPWTFRSGFNQPAAVSAFQVYADAYNKYKVVAPDAPSWSRIEPEYGAAQVAAGIECSCLWEIIATLGKPDTVTPIIQATKTLPFPTQQSSPRALYESNAQVLFKAGGHKDAGWAFSQALMSNMENIWQWTWRQPAPGGPAAQNLKLIAQIPGMRSLIKKYALDTSFFMGDVLKLTQPPFARLRSRCPINPTVPTFAQDLLNVIQQKMTPAQAAADYDSALNTWLKSQTTPAGASMYSSA